MRKNKLQIAWAEYLKERDSFLKDLAWKRYCRIRDFKPPPMSPAELAFKEYMEIPDVKCQCQSHYKRKKEEDEFGEMIAIPLPDSQVCIKERAWRKYCAIRKQFEDEVIRKKEHRRLNKSESDNRYLKSIGRNQ